MPAERCDECGFDSEEWTDDAAIEAIGHLRSRWTEATAGLPPEELQRRPISDMWSIAEYTDHVREVMFGMRFVLDSAIDDPGIALGTAPEPEFTAAPRHIDSQLALAGLSREAFALQNRLRELPKASWGATAIIGEDEVDVHWVSRHAVHDAHHHLEDVRRLRAAL
ncbi:MAG: DinB family protein [Acidimicrobiales bacterium]